MKNTVIQTLKLHGRQGSNAYKKNLGTYGIELETETEKPYEPPKFAFWTTHPDNSLRDFGVEYVLNQPLNYEKQLKEALQEFADKTKHLNFKKNSITTSVHVHINMLNEDWLTVANFLSAYCLTENLLARYAGEDRKSNLFAMPIADAEENYHNIRSLLKSVENKSFGHLYFNPDHVKYAALNLASLDRFGSLECRLFRGETDQKEIYSWVTLLQKLLQYARNPKMNPSIFVERYKEVGPKIVEEIFEDYAGRLINERTPALLKKNLAYPYFLSKVSNNWDDFGEPIKPKASKDLDALAMEMYGKKFEDLAIEVQQFLMEEASKGGIKKKKNPFDHQPEGENPVIAWGNIHARIAVLRNDGLLMPDPDFHVERWANVRGQFRRAEQIMHLDPHAIAAEGWRPDPPRPHGDLGFDLLNAEAEADDPDEMEDDPDEMEDVIDDFRDDHDEGQF